MSDIGKQTVKLEGAGCTSDASICAEVPEIDPRAVADDLEELIDYTEDEDYDEEESIRQSIISRGPPPAQWNPQKLNFFRDVYRFEDEIKSLAAGLDREEVLNYYGLTDGILKGYDAYFFDICFLRGRMKAKHDAVKHLFTQMRDGKSGTQAALSYLGRFANSFRGEANANSMPKAIKIELIE